LTLPANVLLPIKFEHVHSISSPLNGPEATSVYEKLLVVFETVMLAKYLEDAELGDPMTWKFYGLCKAENDCVQRNR
jgi:hypothetical protein